MADLIHSAEKILRKLASLAVEESFLAWGLQDDLERIQTALYSIIPILTDASNRGISFWLRDLRDVLDDAADVQDDLGYEALRHKVVSSGIGRNVFCFFSRTNPVAHSPRIGRKIKEIRVRLDDIKAKADQYCFHITERVGHDLIPPLRKWVSYSVNESKVIGREEDRENIVKSILADSDGHGDDHNISVIPIVGIGGLGKTTLARLVYNDPGVARHFHSRVSACVSEMSSITRIVKEIIGSLTGKHMNVYDGLETLQLQLRSLVEGKRFLLVLDGMWTDTWWKELKICFASAAKGGTILVTTRQVLGTMTSTTKCYYLQGLSADACWLLVSEVAFQRSRVEVCEKLEAVGRRIAEKCDGLPLAAKVAGNLLMYKPTLRDWMEVLAKEVWDMPVGGIYHFLQLSYNHVSIISQQCLAYCRMLPQDQSIETDTLIKLWMAQGYLSSNEDEEDMETRGYRVLQELQMHSFLQDSDQRIDNKTCKIHGTVHEFLRDSLSKMEYFTMKFDRVTGSDCQLSDNTEQVRHSTLVIAAQSSLPVSVCKLQNLRTLLILSDYAFVSRSWLHQRFEHSRFLRALHFSCCSLEKIPSQLGKLHCLRYLNLSYNRNLMELPETVCDLYYLQTLNLNGCDHLEKLPKGIGNLTNLRHLHILWTLSLSFLPQGIGKLSSLRTLNRFVVSPSSGNKACRLGDLDKLKKLQGYMYIDGLADLTSVDEAKKASLHSKEGLLGLDLWFSGVGTGKDRLDQVLEALQPPLGLRYLGIHYYAGNVLPSWIASLTNLKELILFKCKNCKSFLCVATLPCLESPEIRDMENVTELSFDVEVNGGTAFSKLNRLCLYNMKQLNDWKVTVGGAAASPCPCLLQLSIGNCPELKALPHHLQATTLEELSISECPTLSKLA